MSSVIEQRESAQKHHLTCKAERAKELIDGFKKNKVNGSIVVHFSNGRVPKIEKHEVL